VLVVDRAAQPWQDLVSMLPPRSTGWRPPLVWRALLLVARVLTAAVCRLRVTGEVPARLRGRPLILAINHIGVFDPIAVCAACHVVGLAPRMMAAGGLFRAPVVGSVLRAAGLIRVDRRSPTVAEVLGAAAQALADGSVIAAYPEGRIGLDPSMWPERGKTGLARLAMDCDVPVLPVSQWGAHEVMAWHGWPMMIVRLLRSAVMRPVVRVHFGAPVELTGMATSTPGDAQRATDLIIDALGVGLAPLRRHEPRLPRYVDPTRPLSTARAYPCPVAAPGAPAADTPVVPAG
jgi:1-acyl-sn-glycerol-3-phosphate acyltransferase